MRNRGTLLACLVAFGLSGFAIPVIAAEKTKINFVLDWIVGGRHAEVAAADQLGIGGLAARITEAGGGGVILRACLAQRSDGSNHGCADGEDGDHPGGDLQVHRVRVLSR